MIGNTGAEAPGPPGSCRTDEGERPRVVVIVPAFNEEENLPQTLGELREVQLRHPEWRWLTVVVNDGSSDGTISLLRRLQHTFQFTVLDLAVNVGIGGAVQCGFLLAEQWGADVTLQFDGDGQHPAEAIPQLVEPILAGRADVLVGSRYLSGAGGAVSHLLRRLGTWLFSQLLRALMGVKIKDVTSGFRAFNRPALGLICQCYADDYPEVEAYVPLVRQGFRLEEIPVTMRRRLSGRSSISPLGSSYYMFKVTLAVIVHMIRPLPHPRKAASPADSRWRSRSA